MKLIANFGAGVDHVDLAAAKRAGVAVTDTPDALTDATAELAILLILIAARRAGQGERELRAGKWTGWRPTHLIGIGFTGRVLGLVSFGRIAQSTAADVVLPVNDLERIEDPDGAWRQYVNGTLAGSYQTLFARLDLLILLAAPNFDGVLSWRLEQEHALKRSQPTRVRTH